MTKPVSREVLEARILTRLRLSALNEELRRQNEELARWRVAQEADLEAARATQQAIIPTTPPNLPGWDVRAFYQPLIQVGGDVYGWRPCADGRWLFYLADATGHGAAAALFTTLTTLLFHHASSVSSSPGMILKRVNEEFCEVFGKRSFMTACCATVSPDGRASFASAGHPPILIRRASGKLETLPAEATILGFDKTMEIGDRTAMLEPGDAVLLYTDGLYSLRSQDKQRLVPAAVAKAFTRCGADPECLGKMLDDLRATASADPFDDDLSAVLLRRT